LTAAGSDSAGSPWRLRRARAVALLERTSHAEELLGFYVGLMELQERVAERVPVDRWVPLVREPPDSFVRLAVDRLPVREMVSHFDGFLEGVSAVGTEVIRDSARDLLEADEARRSEALHATLVAGRGGDGGAPERGGGGSEPADFHARAFVEPLITTLAAAVASLPPEPTRGRCFVCGALPQVSVLRDAPDAVGARSLLCSMCATEWRFPRLTCPHCGETDADRLPVHTAEAVPHVRIDTCLTCRRYIKSVDVRRDGTAVPLVDEVATVELDLWAGDQGLSKIRSNLLGL